MTRKDYVALANALGEILGDVRSTRQESDSDLLQGIDSGIGRAAHKVASVLAADNGSFRSGQFMEAIEYRARTGKLVKVGQTRFDA